MGVVDNSEPRRRLSQFFAGILNKTEKSGTAAHEALLPHKRYKISEQRFTPAYRGYLSKETVRL